jgi:hypothetical protein
MASGCGLPPSHTALVRTEAFPLRPRCMPERTSAVRTGISGYGLFPLYRNVNVISTAVGLDGVRGYSKVGGDSGVAVASAA